VLHIATGLPMFWMCAFATVAGGAASARVRGSKVRF
jgi:hypothetical protein